MANAAPHSQNPQDVFPGLAVGAFAYSSANRIAGELKAQHRHDEMMGEDH